MSASSEPLSGHARRGCPGRGAARPPGRRCSSARRRGPPPSIRVAANGRSANAKSILEVLALGATGGTELVISASGPDAAEAVERLAELVAGLT